MPALAGIVLAAVAGVLLIIGRHGGWVDPLIIIAVMLIGLDEAWGWTRRRGVQ